MRNHLDQFTRITHALSDPNRIRLLCACLDSERCVCQLVALFDLSNPSISKHLGVLRDAGLLESRKDGRWVHYKTPDNPDPAVLDALSFVRAHAFNDEVIQNDTHALGHIDSIEPGELARMQREGCCVPIPSTPPIPPTTTNQESRS